MSILFQMTKGNALLNHFTIVFHKLEFYPGILMEHSLLSALSLLHIQSQPPHVLLEMG